MKTRNRLAYGIRMRTPVFVLWYVFPRSWTRDQIAAFYFIQLGGDPEGDRLPWAEYAPIEVKHRGSRALMTQAGRVLGEA